MLKSKEAPCLQAVDYFLWALQRFYEVKRDHVAKQKGLDPSTGLVIREDRFLKAMWPQVGEIHDLHFGPAQGTLFTAQHPFSVQERLGGDGRKKKRS